MSQGSTTRTHAALPPKPGAGGAEQIATVWTYRPLQQGRLGVLAVAVFMLAVVAWVLIVTSKPHLAILAGLATAVVLWRKYLPVTYEVGHAGIRQKVLRWSQMRAWSNVAVIRCVDEGFQIENRSDDSFRPWGKRAVLIPWGQHEGEVRACLHRLVPHLIEGEPGGRTDEGLTLGNDG